MQCTRRDFVAGAGAAIAAAAFAQPSPDSVFTITDDGKRLTVRELGKPVFVYNYAPVDVPDGVPARFRRANYLHPVYAPDGTVITEDFPADHYHHRGVFWAWPNCQVNGRKLNVWELEQARPVFQKFTDLDASRERFRLRSQSVWQFDDDGFAPIEESIELTAYPAREGRRVLEFQLLFRNIAEHDVIFQGSPASAGTAGTGAKGYGGFCYRPDAAKKPFVFTAANGVVAEDRMHCDTSWVDISWGPKRMGVTIAQHPDNPGYPHPGWMIRHYGFLGVSWPHTSAYTLKPGDSFTLRYRMTIHNGDA